MKYKFLIASILLIGIFIIAASIAIGIAKRDVVVEEDPYETGLRFDERLKRYAELGWKVELPYSVKAVDNKLKVRVIDKDDKPVEGAIVEYVVNKCADTHIRNYRCDYIGNGYYQAAVDLRGASCVEVKVNVKLNSDVLSFDNKVYVEK